MANHRLIAPGRRAGGSPTARLLAAARVLWAAAAALAGLVLCALLGWCAFRLLATAGPHWPVPAALMATTAVTVHAVRRWARPGGAR